MDLDTSRKIVFLTSTRADFGKLKSLIIKLDQIDTFDVHVFVTGMHTLARYGNTWEEVRKAGIGNLYLFINQNPFDSMDQILSKTVSGFSDYVRELQPDMIVVHGDRLEALSGAVVGAFNNIRVAHIEGGEVSGTIDESIRHTISKLAHVHFVANETAERRLIRLGEMPQSIHIIGSPDVDIMMSSNLPSVDEVKNHYGFNFDRYAVLIFHPVTTEQNKIALHAKQVVQAVLDSALNYIVIYPNNDPGSDIIFQEYQRFRNCNRIAIFPSMRFEYFLVAIENAAFMLGNSSSGIYEAPFFGVPTINVGTRQSGRANSESIVNVDADYSAVLNAIHKVDGLRHKPKSLFGEGKSADLFVHTLESKALWNSQIQKVFNEQG